MDIHVSKKARNLKYQLANINFPLVKNYLQNLSLKLQMILKKTLPHNFLWLNRFHVLTQTALIKNLLPEIGHATVKYFIKILKF